MVLRKKILHSTLLVVILMMITSCGSESKKNDSESITDSTKAVSTLTEAPNVKTDENTSSSEIDNASSDTPDTLPVELLYDKNIYVYSDNITDESMFPEMDEDTYLGEILSAKNETPKDEFSATFAYAGAKLYAMKDGRIAVYLDKSNDGEKLIDVNPHVLILKKES